MSTSTEKQELRITFNLRRSLTDGVEETTRTISLPVNGWNGTTQTALLIAMRNFRNTVVWRTNDGSDAFDYWFTNLVDMGRFVQPANWLDVTGSTETWQPGTSDEPFRTTGISFEVVVTTSTAWSDQELSS